MQQILFQKTESCETNSGEKEEMKTPIDIAIEKARKLAEELDKIEVVLSEEIEEERASEKKDEEACRYNLSKEEAKRRVTGMKEYLMSVAKMPFSEALPPPYLERHQAYLLFGGYRLPFRKLETVVLGMSCFSHQVIEAVVQSVHGLFKRQQGKRPPGSKIEFTPLIPDTPMYTYELPGNIPDHPPYINHVLIHEAITKLVMDLEGCDYLTATGIALKCNKPTRTPYGQRWESLVAEANERKQVSKTSTRKQKKPKRVIRKK